MVAGVTPTTVKAGFVSVSTVLEVGYHIELAGGGHCSPTAFRAKVVEIQGKISLGIGLTLNLLYINPCQFSFQPLLWQDMRCYARTTCIVRAYSNVSLSVLRASSKSLHLVSVV